MTDRDKGQFIGAGADDSAAGNPDYLARRREIMAKLAAGAIATPAILSTVTAKAAASSVLPPPPPRYPPPPS